MKSIRLLAFSFIALVPVGALADGAGEIAKPHVSASPPPRTAERGPCTGSGEIGRIASLTGEVRALVPGGAARSLGCDDAVNACETIVTGPGGGASLIVSDAIVQLGPDTQVELAARSAPEVTLERGGVRVVDTRAEASDRVQLYTPALAASTGRGDAELTRDADSATACAHAESLVVTARDGAQTVPAGHCVSALTGPTVVSGLATALAGPASVALGDPASCPFRVAAMPALLPPVAAAGSAGPEVSPFEPPGRDSCDEPGSGCASDRQIFDDPDPGTGCGFPGSSCGE